MVMINYFRGSKNKLRVRVRLRWFLIPLALLTMITGFIGFCYYQITNGPRGLLLSPSFATTTFVYWQKCLFGKVISNAPVVDGYSLLTESELKFEEKDYSAYLRVRMSLAEYKQFIDTARLQVKPDSRIVIAKGPHSNSEISSTLRIPGWKSVSNPFQNWQLLAVRLENNTLFIECCYDPSEELMYIYH